MPAVAAVPARVGAMRERLLGRGWSTCGYGLHHPGAITSSLSEQFPRKEAELDRRGYRPVMAILRTLLLSALSPPVERVNASLL